MGPGSIRSRLSASELNMAAGWARSWSGGRRGTCPACLLTLYCFVGCSILEKLAVDFLLLIRREFHNLQFIFRTLTILYPGEKSEKRCDAASNDLMRRNWSYKFEPSKLVHDILRAVSGGSLTMK